MKTCSRLPTKAALSVVLSSITWSLPLAAGRIGDSLMGTVTGIRAPDVIAFDYGSGTYVVRIAGVVVDRDSSRTRVAIQFATTLLLGKRVRLRFDGLNAQGEMVGRIWIDGGAPTRQRVRDAGVEMVRAGVVRSQEGYREYKYGEMQQAEREARSRRRGIWSR